MGSYEKVVKLACKPKAAPPKAKYLDPILAATWSEDGAVHDVCRALSPRFREPNAIVVFKALIVLHSMIRNGSTDNVLSYLSSSDVFRLRTVTVGPWEGYNPPQHLQHYALYLDSRIRAYHSLKHDAIQVQSESNRDMRNNNAMESNRGRGSGGGSSANKSGSTNLSRSKTMMGRKLRVMTVEKGLLRETKAVHRMIDTLTECRFYLDNLEDDLTVTALRMLVKDLLILFQAGNEGVINLLEHYFEMSHVDAKEALSIYRNFCKQTEAVVEYLGVAKKLQNLLNVPIPNLKHAPVSLAGALQEYLDDPNFEQNRIEYRTNKAAAERGDKTPATKPKPSESTPPVPALPASASNASSSISPSATTSMATTTTTINNNQIVDFFATIEEEQPMMFNPSTNSPSQAYFHQQAATNPFAQRQMAMMTGAPQQIQPQPTGFGYSTAPNPFGLRPLQAQPTGHRPFSSYLQPQATGYMQPQPTGFIQSQPQQTGLLQPQMTGNPFRQSVLVPQTTGMTLFGGMNASVQAQPPNGTNSAFSQSPAMSGTSSSIFLNQPSGTSIPQPSFASPQPHMFAQQQATSMMPSSSSLAFNNTTMRSNSGINPPPRPASTPLTSNGQQSPSTIQIVKTHRTGNNNPFGRVVTPPPAVPRQPTLFELQSGSSQPLSGNFTGIPAQQTGFFGELPQSSNGSNAQGQQSGSFQPTVAGDTFGFNTGALNAGKTDMASVASSFTFQNQKKDEPNANSQTTGAPAPMNTSQGLNGQIGFSSNSSPLPSSRMGPSISVSPPIKAQMTGMVGIKEFKPSSSFGASLLESLPPIPDTPTGGQEGSGGRLNGMSSSTSPSGPTSGIGVGTNPTGVFGSMGSGLGTGLRPQMTGGGAANPFRASFAGGLGGFGGSAIAAGNAFGSNGFGNSAGSTRPAQNESLI